MTARNDTPVEKPPVTLASWRTLPLTDLMARREDLGEMLGTLTAFEDESLRGHLASAMMGIPSAALVVAEALAKLAADRNPGGFEDSFDLVWSWIAYAGAERSGPGGPGAACPSVAARVAVAAKLMSRASNFGKREAAERAATEHLALGWLEGFSARFKHSNVVETFAAVTDTLPSGRKPKQDTKSKSEIENFMSSWGSDLSNEAGAAGAYPTKVVVKEIGEARGDREDKALVQCWKPLTAPLPLKGGDTDPDDLRSVLSDEFPWMDAAIDAVVGDIALRRRAGADWAHFRPVLLVGPPGCGKTRFAQRLAAVLDVGFGEINAAGSSDNRLLAGTARGWSSASPSVVMHVMRRAKAANPVMFVDEIDKMNPDGRNGDIRQTLLGMLEPISAKAWPDECLMAECDLSAVNWIVCANETTRLRGPLLTRLRVVEIGMPGGEHFDTVMRTIRGDLADELGIPVEELPELEPEAAASLRRAFGRGHSLRRIKHAVEGAVRVSWWGDGEDAANA